MNVPEQKPVPTKRIEVIDVLRGFALLGIFLTHVFLANMDHRTMPMTQTDRILEHIFRAFWFGRFYTIFSLLFGLSFAIQLGAASQKTGSFVRRFLWRLAILFVIGYLHFLIFEDDILQAYAFLGILLVLIRNLSVRQLLIISGVIFLTIPLAGITAPAMKAVYLGNNAWNNAGSFFRKLSFYMYDKQLLIITMLFLLGLIAGKKKIFTGNHPIFAVRSYLIGLAVAVVSTIIVTVLIILETHYKMLAEDLRILSCFIAPIQQFSVSYCYMTTVVLLHRNGIRNVLDLFGRVGKIGMTAYVMQSVLIISATPLIINVDLLGCVGITLVLFSFQILFAGWWIKRYKSGPLEWLWRSLTYLRIQPIRKQPEPETTSLVEA